MSLRSRWMRAESGSENMAPHADILEDRESLRNPFIASVMFHVSVFAFFFAWNASSQANKFVIGTKDPGFGSSVNVNPVSAIPLPPRKGPLNPVANDTESLVPLHEAQKVQPRKRQPEP